MSIQTFPGKNDNFNKHAKFTIIDKLTNTKKLKEILRQRLTERKKFWIQTLDTIFPKGLNQELSKLPNSPLFTSDNIIIYIIYRLGSLQNIFVNL